MTKQLVVGDEIIGRRTRVVVEITQVLRYGYRGIVVCNTLPGTTSHLQRDQQTIVGKRWDSAWKMLGDYS